VRIGLSGIDLQPTRTASRGVPIQRLESSAKDASLPRCTVEVRIVRHTQWHTLLAPQGALLFTNIKRGNPYRVWLEYLANWTLTERDEGEIQRCCSEAQVPPSALHIQPDGTGLALVVTCQRRTTHLRSVAAFLGIVLPESNVRLTRDAAQESRLFRNELANRTGCRRENRRA
jgi:hypothetical protein